MTNPIPQTSASERVEAARKALALVGGPGREKTLARALRALITPPGVGESEEAIANRLIEEVMDYARSGWLDGRELAMAGLLYGIRAGIQSAHESWEPADRPSQEMMLRWLGIKAERALHQDTLLFIPDQHIEKEVM